MTTLFPATVKCAVCGAENRINMIGSTNAFGSMDLDMRPPPMERDLVTMTIHRCIACGYCAPDLESVADVGTPDVQAPEYQKALHEERFPSPARNYRAHSYLAEQAGSLKGAAWGYLRAAWVCDDSGAAVEGAADQCRRDVLRQLATIHAAGDLLHNDADTDLVFELDLLRRCGEFVRFASLIAECSVNRLPPILQKIVQFQSSLAGAKDRGCYRVDQAIECLD